VTDCSLATVRLIHGALEAGRDFSDRQIHQGVAAALLHDVGYLQRRE
jgi:predicted HD phosphohydrolase